MHLTNVRRNPSGTPMLTIDAARLLRDLYITRSLPNPERVWRSTQQQKQIPVVA